MREFEALERSIELVRLMRLPLATIARRDRGLADQARRALTSVPLNLAEGSRRAGGDRLHAYRVAAGSADEVLVALRVADALGYLTEAQAREALDMADRVIAILTRILHPRRA